MSAVATVAGLAQDFLACYAPGTTLTAASLKAAVPAVAKDPGAAAEIERLIREVPTEHRLLVGDARRLDCLDDQSVRRGWNDGGNGRYRSHGAVFGFR